MTWGSGKTAYWSGLIIITIQRAINLSNIHCLRVPGLQVYWGTSQQRSGNTGVEIVLSTVNIQQKNLKWSTSFNLTIPKNKLLAFDNLANSSYANTYVIGKPLTIAKRYFNLGVDPQTGIYIYQDVDRDNKISAPNDQQSVVFTGQQYYGGFENVIQYKKLTISLNLQFVRQKNATSYLSLFGRPGTVHQINLGLWWIAGSMLETLLSIQRFSNSNSLKYYRLFQFKIKWCSLQ